MPPTPPAPAPGPAGNPNTGQPNYNEAFKRGFTASFFALFIALGIEGIWLLVGSYGTDGLHFKETLLAIVMSVGVTALLAFGLAVLDNLAFLGLFFLEKKIEKPALKTATAALGLTATISPAALLLSSYASDTLAEPAGFTVLAMVFAALTYFLMRRVRRGKKTFEHPLALFATSLVSTWIVFYLINSHLILERLHSHHHADLALKYYLLLMAACPALAYSLYRVAIMKLRPRFPSPAQRRRPIEAAAFLGSLGATVAVYLFDVLYLPGLYPEFHTFLKLFVYLGAQATFVTGRILVLSVKGASRLGAATGKPALKYSLASVFLVSTVATLVIFEGQTTVGSFLLSRPNLVSKAITIERDILDFDMDGHSGVLAGGDCDDLDPKINPGMREIVANGIDENCFGGDLSLEEANKHSAVSRALQDRDHLWWSAHESNTKKPYNVLLITIDALRADHCGFMGYPRNTTPRLDQLAQDAWVFENAYCQGGWTSISLPTLLKGVLPYEISYTNVYEDNYLRLWFPHELHPGIRPLKMFTVPAFDKNQTIAQLLKQNDYRTLALLNDGITDYFQEKFGYTKGFDVYYHNNSKAVLNDPSLKSRRRSTAKEMTALAVEELEKLPADKPFFMWVHHFDPHTPYYATKFNSWGKSSMDYYDGEVAFTDHYVGVLIDKLEEQSRLEDTIVIVTADHGEAFGEHGNSTHGLSGYQEEIRVPLIIRVPGAGLAVVEENVGLVDIVPTVMNLLNLDTQSIFSGRSLLPLVYGKRGDPREVISMTWRYSLSGVRESSIKTLIKGRHKVILNEIGFFWEMYDLKSDPHERNNISGDDPETFEALKEDLMQHVERDHEGLIEMTR